MNNLRVLNKRAENMLLSLYEGRLTRIMEKQRAELKAFQSERKEAREKALNHTAIFVEHAESKGKEYDPGEDFQPASAHGQFVFVRQESLADLVNGKEFIM